MRTLSLVTLSFFSTLVTLALIATLAARPASADDTAFDRPFAIAAYGAVRGGDYTAGGVGGRARWELFSFVGLELYLEATLVDWPGALRHDYANGFNLYVPIRAGQFRARPYFGFCDVLSFIEPSQEGAPRADDVMLGVHFGVGTEWSLGKHWSVFADTQVDVYAGHDRATGGWTGNVDEELREFWTVQLNVGVQLHFGAPR
jgi:hypothetical protein